MLITTAIAEMPALRVQDYVLYDHDGVVAINKPAGMISRGAAGAPKFVAYAGV